MEQIRIFSFLLLIAGTVTMGCKSSTQVTEEWVQLFNGKDLTGWTPKFNGYPVGENFNNTFRVENGILMANYSEYDTFRNEFGHLFYKKPFSNYHLRVEYKFEGEQVEGGEPWAYRNNGVMFHAQSAESMGLDQAFPVSIEFQFLGGNGSDDRPNCNMCSPGTHIVLADTIDTRHCINSTSGTFHGDDWVTAELVVYGDSIIHHIVEGDTVITYSHPTLGGQFLPEDYSLPAGSAVTSGYLAVQAESADTYFRKIEIRELK